MQCQRFGSDDRVTPFTVAVAHKQRATPTIDRRVAVAVICPDEMPEATFGREIVDHLTGPSAGDSVGRDDVRSATRAGLGATARACLRFDRGCVRSCCAGKRTGCQRQQHTADRYKAESSPHKSPKGSVAPLIVRIVHLPDANCFVPVDPESLASRDYRALHPGAQGLAAESPKVQMRPVGSITSPSPRGIGTVAVTLNLPLRPSLAWWGAGGRLLPIQQNTQSRVM